MKTKKRKNSLLNTKVKGQNSTLGRPSRREFLKQAGYKCIGFAGLVFSAKFSSQADACQGCSPCDQCNQCNQYDCPTGFKCNTPLIGFTCPSNTCQEANTCGDESGGQHTCNGTEGAPNTCNTQNDCVFRFTCNTNHTCQNKNICNEIHGFACNGTDNCVDEDIPHW